MAPTLSKRELATISDGQLKDLANRGIVRVMRSTDKPLCNLCYTDYPQYRKHARWKGKKITISEAARLFKIPKPTIHRWTARGYITVLQRTRREVYLDRADAAYCAEIYAERPGAGRWLFNADRTPHNATSRRPAS